jgi:hypothetical protein
MARVACESINPSKKPVMTHAFFCHVAVIVYYFSLGCNEIVQLIECSFQTYDMDDVYEQSSKRPAILDTVVLAAEVLI